MEAELVRVPQMNVHAFRAKRDQSGKHGDFAFAQASKNFSFTTSASYLGGASAQKYREPRSILA